MFDSSVLESDIDQQMGDAGQGETVREDRIEMP